eukprot:2409404-Rhodomonas_salina.1
MQCNEQCERVLRRVDIGGVVFTSGQHAHCIGALQRNLEWGFAMRCWSGVLGLGIRTGEEESLDGEERGAEVRCRPMSTCE